MLKNVSGYSTIQSTENQNKKAILKEARGNNILPVSTGTRIRIVSNFSFKPQKQKKKSGVKYLNC